MIKIRVRIHCVCVNKDMLQHLLPGDCGTAVLTGDPFPGGGGGGGIPPLLL